MIAMSKGVQRRLRFVCALVAALVVVLGATAHAKPSPSHHRTAGPNAGAQHCVMNLSSHRSMQCFPSFRAAIKSATRGRVTDAPNDVMTAMASRRLAAELNQSRPSLPNRMLGNLDRMLGVPNVTLGQGPYVLAVEYQNADYQGASLTLTGSHPCSESPYDIDYQVPSLSASYDYGWNDVISSFFGWWCRTKLFEDVWYDGASYFSGSSQYVGAAMNDRASSIQLT